MSVVHIILAAKGVDAVAVTALGALRSLLGFGDSLWTLERFRLFEVTSGTEESTVVRSLEGYLQRTFEFWNPNKERCWIRTGKGALEVIPGQAPRTSPVPGVGADSLLLWQLPDSGAALRFDRPGPEGAQIDPSTPDPDTELRPTASQGLPRDFPRELGGDAVVARRGEVYSFSWSDEPDENERRARIERAGAVRNRGEGLLVQPQYQLSRISIGSLPWPVWEPELTR